MADVLANFWNSVVLQWLWPLAQFIIGLGVVVFFHELGHFLAARWAGIRVDRFALGFGPRLLGVKKGETDYCVCAVPLGGYVKMLGQEDFAPLDEDAEPDPRSFAAKPVGKRMVVIAAGVVMNVILALILFVIVGLVGMDFPAPVVGGAMVDYPARVTTVQWDGPAPPQQAPAGWDDASQSFQGLQAGDRILTMGGEPVTQWLEVALQAALASADDTIEVTFERPWGGQVYRGRCQLAVKGGPQGLLAFGLIQPSSNTIATTYLDGLQADDRIVRLDETPIEQGYQIERFQETLRYRPVEMTVQRGTGRKGEALILTRRPDVLLAGDVIYLTSGKRLKGFLLADNAGSDEPQPYITAEGQTIDVPPDQALVKTADGHYPLVPSEQLAGGGYTGLLDVLGMTPRTQVLSVQEKLNWWRLGGSPAAQAGLKPGDIIISYGDRATPTVEQIRQISNELVGKETSIVVQRDGQTQTLSITPAEKNGQALMGIMNTQDLDHLTVASVRENSAADRAGVPRGATITAVNGQSVSTWAELVAALQAMDDPSVTLTATVGSEQRDFDLGPIDQSAFAADDYEWVLLPRTGFTKQMVMIRHTNPLRAIAAGTEGTFMNVMTVYGTLRGMITGTVKFSAISGPVGIAEVAVKTAQYNLVNLVYLMAVLSVSLAVINFLPIPVLDGGHAALLIVEKIRGKPLPVKVVNAIQMIGLALILGVMLLVTYKDIVRLLD